MAENFHWHSEHQSMKLDIRQNNDIKPHRELSFFLTTSIISLKGIIKQKYGQLTKTANPNVYNKCLQQKPK